MKHVIKTIVLLTTVAFVCLKLFGVVSWSWLAVLSPLWLSAVGGFILGIGIGIAKYIKTRD